LQKTWQSLPRSFDGPTPIVFVGSHNFLHQSVPDNVGLAELDNIDTSDVTQTTHGID
jgi:hypothetical protein